MGLRPPKHRIDAEPRFILAEDDAWDHERINRERADLAARKADGTASRDEKHPVDAYAAGDTRYDLGASGISEYVDLAQAWQFVLRRLLSTDFYAIDAMLSRGARLLAYRQACVQGLVRIDGPGAPTVQRDASGNLEPSTVEALFQMSAGLPAAVGEAVYIASLALRPDEKKP